MSTQSMLILFGVSLATIWIANKSGFASKILG